MLQCRTQGLCRMTSTEFMDPLQAVRLLMHECERVLSDRLVSDTDLAKFKALSLDVTRKHFSGMALVRCLHFQRRHRPAFSWQISLLRGSHLHYVTVNLSESR